MAEDLDWEKHLDLYRRPQRMNGVGARCWRPGCPKHRHTRWYYGYQGEPFDAADKRQAADGWIAVREPDQDDEQWAQVYGWFCSPECLRSEAGDKVRAAATEAFKQRLAKSRIKTSRAAPTSMRWYRRFWRWLTRSSV